MKAKIFQRNIMNNAEQVSYNLVNSFDEAEIELNTQTIKIKTKKGETFQYKLTYSEQDAFTETFLGQFDNGNKFRLIKPIGVALKMTKLESSAADAFSFGSISPTGWAIHFHLFA
jgi:hypothetical protein